VGDAGIQTLALTKSEILIGWDPKPEKNLWR